MAMKKSWFSLVKRLFIWDSHSTTQDKKEKRRKWVFGRIKSKRLATIGAPPAALSREKTTKLSEAEEEQSKHALTVAFASAAAEAAVAAAQVAAEVVLLTGVPQSSHKLNKEKSQEEEEESQTAKTRNADPHYTNQSIKEFAAIKIQTSFRGYLARKALRALKGIVKLQAIIRGRAVRRQAMSTLKCLQSIVSIQSQVCARRLKMAEGKWDYIAENEEMLQDSKDKIIRMDLNSERKWDDSTLLKEEVYASCISKKEAALKRERIKEYSFNHRRSAETERSKVNGRWRYWMEQWVDTQLSKSKELEDLDSVFSSNSRVGDEHGLRHLKLRNMQNNNREGLDSPIVLSRKGFPHHRRQCSVGEDSNNNNNNNNCSSFSSSPVTPAYMAATESARAKARSTSSPRVRTGNLECESFSPCKKKISINSEVLRNGKFCATQQRSPSFKGISVPIKSRGTTVIKDLSINSDCSLPNWDRQSSFK